MEKKSIKVNALFSLIQSISAVIFPLITFPYISRIFGVEQLGKYNYAKNFVEIFATIAMLGIPTYGQREGAKVRDNRKELSNLMSELFSLSMLSNAIAMLTLYLATYAVDAFHSYALLIVIFSVTIPMTTIGMSWLFVVFEDYNFTTILGIIFNILSVVTMFLFVRTRTDIYLYAFITVIASCGSNLIKFVYSKKYCDIKLTFHINFRRHMKPILLMFSAYISVMIYNKTDTALLGVMGSDCASSKGYIVRWVEAPSNKLLTTAFEASLESVTVTCRLSVDSKIAGIAMEHRNPKVSEGRHRGLGGRQYMHLSLW